MERAEAGDAGSSGGLRGHAMESTASTALCSHTAARAVAQTTCIHAVHTRQCLDMASSHLPVVSRYGGVVKRRAGGAGGVGGAKRECGR